MKKYKNGITRLFALIMIVSLVPLASLPAFAAEDTEDEETVTIPEIEVVDEKGTPVSEPIEFEFLDDSGEEDSQFVTTKNGKLSGIALTPGNSYTVFLGMDAFSDWQMLDPETKKEGTIRIVADPDGKVYFSKGGKKCGPATRFMMKRMGQAEPEEEQAKVKIRDIQMVYEDGKPVEDGVTVNLLNRKEAYSKAETLTTKNGGKLVGIELIPEQKYSIGFHMGNRYSKKLELVDSQYGDNLMQIYAKKEGGAALYYPDTKGDKANDTPVTKLVVRPPRLARPRYAPEQYMGIYTAPKVVLKGLPVRDQDGNALTKPVKFLFFNTQKQEFEKTVVAKNGVLPDVEMTKGHYYIVYAEDAEYAMSNQYVALDQTGASLRIGPSKASAGPVKEFRLTKRATPSADPTQDKRVKCKLPVYDSVNDTRPSGVKLTFTSSEETVTAVTNAQGDVEFSLIEDLMYMVNVDDSRYGIESFPMTVKDHSEKGWDKIPYMHLTCGNVDYLNLVAKGTEHDNDTTLISPNGKTTLTGLNFLRGEYFVNDRDLPDHRVPTLAGRDYEVFDVDTINMYRVEISKLATGSFTLTRELPAGKKVKQVYYIDKDGKLNPVPFTQQGAVVTYRMDSVGLYHNVIEYDGEAAIDEDAYVLKSADNLKWQKGSAEALEFVFKRNKGDAENDTFTKFLGIEVDGKAVASEHYTATPGSVKIALKASYLNTLDPKLHTLKAKFRDGKEATANFTVMDGSVAVDGGAKGTMKRPALASVKTGDNGSAVLFAGLAGAALLALASLLRCRRRKNAERA